MENKTFKLSLIIAAIYPHLSYAADSIEVNDTAAMEVIEVHAYRSNYQNEETTSASKMALSQLETPRAILTIDKKLIEDQQATSLSTVLKNASSTQSIMESDGHEAFSIRGFELSTNEGYLRDGEQKYSLIQEPVEMYESVEVLTGPAGLLYGQSAPGGLINMITKKPMYQNHVSMTQDIGADNFYRSVLDVTGPLTDKIRARVIASKQSQDSWRHYKDGNSPTTTRNLFAVMIDADLSDDTMISLRFDDKEQNGFNDSGAIFDEKGNLLVNKDVIWDQPWSVNNKDETSYGLKLVHFFDSDWKFSASAHHLDMKNDAQTGSPKAESIQSDGSYMISAGNRHNSYNVNTASFDLTGEFETGNIQHRLLVGSNLVDHSYKRRSSYGAIVEANINPNTGIPGIPTDYPSPESSNQYDRETYGIYTQDLITFNDQWEILVGARYDIYVKHKSKEDAELGKGEDRTYTNVLPNLSIMYHPTDNTTIYTTYSESFQPKDPVDSITDANDGMERDPEMGLLYEVGFKYKMSEALLTTSIFQIKKENISITTKPYVDPDDSSIDRITQQQGSEIHNGIDINLTGRIHPLVTLSAGAAYIDAKYEDQPEKIGVHPTDIPHFKANAWVNYALTNKLDLNLGVYYTGDSYGDNKNEEDKNEAYTLLDFGAIYRMNVSEDHDVKLQFKINNILDEDYVTGGDYSGKEFGRGRNYILTGTYQF
ncbi:TonB-dependent siderophore receptor [Shewanella violacea]|uniref:TonB-dependent siderophore receptor n=1 Tax=Shewanella violacea (strain JCM 10179 / CIP 106290 / LMG 19151 / DSS12) TaxID=637905 RepID=D4ZI69_SHEVD|nr:TonB-dependent siderophore receptor [Shewanella violacea]BAJ01368.1 TonB-dependent siderophore receptor [Shewanella violacea DSS12]